MDSWDDVHSAQVVPLPAGAGASQVACGRTHSCVVTTSGQLLACGRNCWGELGLGHDHSTSRFTAVPTPAPVCRVACGFSHTCALTVDGTVLTCGINGHGQLGLKGVPLLHGKEVRALRPVSLAVGAARVACGHAQTFAVSAAGTLLAWGSNEAGGLGLGHAPQRPPHEFDEFIRATSVRLPELVPLPAGALRVVSVGDSAGCAKNGLTAIAMLG